MQIKVLLSILDIVVYNSQRTHTYALFYGNIACVEVRKRDREAHILKAAKRKYATKKKYLVKTLSPPALSHFLSITLKPSLFYACVSSWQKITTKPKIVDIKL